MGRATSLFYIKHIFFQLDFTDKIDHTVYVFFSSDLELRVPTLTLVCMCSSLV